MKVDYWIYFLKRWSILIILFAVLGVISSSYLIKPKYTNNISMEFKETSAHLGEKKKEINLYYQTINNMDIYNRILILKNDMPDSIRKNVDEIQKNITIIQSPKDKTFMINYTSSNKSEINQILNDYANIVVEKHIAIYSYEIIKHGLGQIHEVNQNMYKVLFAMLGVFLGIILSICLDMLFCKNKKITEGGRRRR